MSSRIVREGKIEVQAVDWEPLAGTAPALASHGVIFPQAGARPGPERNADAAQESIEAHVRELERQLESGGQEAFQRGLQQGEAEGGRRAQARLDAEIQSLAHTVREMAGLRRVIRREAEEELVRLALAIARRVLHRELTVDADALRGLVRAALERIELRETYRVRTHPDHVATLTRCLAQTGAPQKIEVIADTSLEKGAAIFETARGSLDASVETQLAEIQRGLVDLLE